MQKASFIYISILENCSNLRCEKGGSIMDKQLIGKWNIKEQHQTLNILSIDPLRINISFEAFGIYHIEPDRVFEKDNYLCFEITIDECLFAYRVRKVNDCLEGVYSQFGTEIPITFYKVSDVPEDESFSVLPMEIYVPETKEFESMCLRNMQGMTEHKRVRVAKRSMFLMGNL